MPPVQNSDLLGALGRFVAWLDAYGETSWDHQSYYAGPVGRRAKALYYKHKLLGTAAVSPMVFSEAFFPAARRLFHRRIRFPIADAHYAMGFAALHRATGDPAHLDRAIHFLRALQGSRSRGCEEYAWGYPFDWVTRNGTIQEGVPLITTVPYCYEAFRAVNQIQPAAEWREVMGSVARHGAGDYNDEKVSDRASTCSYTPTSGCGVINASAYRAFLLTAASRDLSEPGWWDIAERNLNFVLENQNPDGSWFYAVDGVRDFVDHFHTCFVMKALAKVHALTGHAATLGALRRGVAYYRANLFGDDGMPKPFSKAPRLTVYECELYDCAEAINLCLLLRDRFPELDENLGDVTGGVLQNWVQPSGAFRARRLKFGWDNTPMHRWAQSQMFRSLASLAASREAIEQDGTGARES